VQLIHGGKLRVCTGGIDKFTSTGVVTGEGEEVGPLDMVVMATGWVPAYQDLLPDNAKELLKKFDDGAFLYRHVVHPSIDDVSAQFACRFSSLMWAPAEKWTWQIVFIGSNATTVSSPLTHGIQIKLVLSLLTRGHSLPCREDMAKDIMSMRTWRQRLMSYSRLRGSIIGLHQLHYHGNVL